MELRCGDNRDGMLSGSSSCSSILIPFAGCCATRLDGAQVLSRLAMAGKLCLSGRHSPGSTSLIAGKEDRQERLLLE
jgi:hypothetical protein